MNKKKKLLIPTVLVLILFMAILSGCIGSGIIPVVTWSVGENPKTLEVVAEGWWSVFCEASDQCFVYDTKSHDTWEDYKTIKKADIINHDMKWFWSSFGILSSGTTYYCRAVAYCYDFWGPLKHFEDGWYQGKEKSCYG